MLHLKEQCFNICFNISASKAGNLHAEAKKANGTAVLLLQCFVFCMVMYYLFIGNFCWISGLISHLIHLTCEYMTSLFVSVTDHLGSTEWEQLGRGGGGLAVQEEMSSINVVAIPAGCQ